MRAASAVVGAVAIVAALVATAPHDRTPHDHLVANAPLDRTPHDRLVANEPLDRTTHDRLVANEPLDRTPHDRLVANEPHDYIHQARLNATDTEANNHRYNHHKVVQHLKNSRQHEATHARRHLPQKTTAWRRITDTLTQAFLSYTAGGDDGDDGDNDDDDDDDDESSSSDREPDTKNTNQEPQKANGKAKHSRLTALVSSALSQLGFTHLPKLWQKEDKKKKFRKKARRKQASAAKRTFDKVTVSNKVNENATKEEETRIKEYRDGELAVEEGVPIVEQIFQMAGRSDVLSNPLSSLQEIERKVEASGRKLTFIEYVAMFEIMVLAVIAAGVFKSNLPAPIAMFAKA